MVKPILAALAASACMAGAQGATNVPPTVSMTGPAANANFVAAANITLTATAADSNGTVSKVVFYKGTTLLATVTTAPYSYNWTNVAAGSYSITAKATDNNSAVTTSAALIVTVKANVAPTVAIATPANNASFVAPATIALTANAADSDGTVSKVDYYNGATLLGTASVAPYALNWVNPAVGNYSITAKATDDKGAVTTSAAVGVTVKTNTAPSVAITAPVANASLVGPATISLAATASDSDGTVNKVEFYNGATLIGTANAVPFTATWSGVAPGSYSITAKATDDKGAVTTSSAMPLTVTANVAPTVSLTAPVNNAAYIAPATITLSASAADSDGTVNKVEFYSGATLIGTATAAPYAATWSNVAAGTYSITAKATDNNGATTVSPAVNVTVANNVAPTVSLAVTPNTATAPATITLTSTATDADGSVAKVEFYNGAALLATVTQAPFAYTWGNVDAGTYNLTARATDNLGSATTSQMAQVTVTAGSNAQLYIVYADQVDTAREITNAAGTVVWRADTTEPFGANMPNENPSGQGQFTYNQRFPGQYFDKETGLHYNYYRDYDPQTGRYVQSDPIGLEGGINTYAYVGGNPLRSTDPKGLNPGTVLGAEAGTLILPGVGTVVGAVIGTGLGIWIGYELTKPDEASNSPIESSKADRERASRHAANVIAKSQGRNGPDDNDDKCDRQEKADEQQCLQLPWQGGVRGRCMASAAVRAAKCRAGQDLPDLCTK